MTPTNILQDLQYNDLMKMRTVSEVMQSSVIHASPSADLLSIAQIMTQKKISSVVIAQEAVMGSGRKVFPVGVILERDVELLQGLELDLANIQAKTAIGSSLFSVRATDSLFDALSQMQRRNLQQLVVVGDAGELVGILTQSKCLQGLCAVKKKTVYLRIQNKN